MSPGAPGLLLGVAAAGAAGAVARYVLDYAVSSRAAGVGPWGTWLVNISGAFALGLLVGVHVQVGLGEGVLAVVGAGFLGAYTTFSTWMYETLRLIEQSAWRAAAVNIVGSLLTGVLAAAAGLALGLLAGLV